MHRVAAVIMPLVWHMDETEDSMSTIGPAEVHQALAGLTFPASRQQILDHLGEDDVSALVRPQIEAMPDGIYQNMDEVDDALSDESY